MKLNLIQCHPNPRRLAAWATRFGQNAGGIDMDYALHTLLTAAFGDAAAKPFRYFEDARGLLAYSRHDAESLQLAAQMSPPDVHAALGLERFATRSFPTEWASGRRLGFEVRVRPVLRTTAGRERDIFQMAAEKTGAGEFEQTREMIYGEWLARELARSDAARISGLRLEAFRLVTSLRKGRSADGKRTGRRVTGPDAVIVGELVVGNPESFAALLARGIGRHRAFGFGMLLLRPPATC